MELDKLQTNQLSILRVWSTWRHIHVGEVRNRVDEFEVGRLKGVLAWVKGDDDGGDDEGDGGA